MARRRNATEVANYLRLMNSSSFCYANSIIVTLAAFKEVVARVGGKIHTLFELLAQPGETKQIDLRAYLDDLPQEFGRGLKGESISFFDYFIRRYNLEQFFKIGSTEQVNWPLALYEDWNISIQHLYMMVNLSFLKDRLGRRQVNITDLLRCSFSTAVDELFQNYKITTLPPILVIYVDRSPASIRNIKIDEEMDFCRSRYRLRSVICRTTAYGGHFVAYVNVVGNQWLFYNDMTSGGTLRMFSKIASDTTVLTNSYMYFYERVGGGEEEEREGERGERGGEEEREGEGGVEGERGKEERGGEEEERELEPVHKRARPGPVDMDSSPIRIDSSPIRPDSKEDESIDSSPFQSKQQILFDSDTDDTSPIMVDLSDEE